MILQNYIFRNVAINTINITIILFSMIWLILSLRQIDLVIKNGASLFDFLYISILPGPLWLMMIIPMSSLIAVIFSLNRFTTDKEIFIFQFSGANIYFLLKPILLICFFNLIFLSIINIYIIPKAYSLFKSKQFELRNNISHIFLREGVFNDLEDGLTILIDRRVSKFGIEGVFIYDTREKNKEIDIFAKQGKIILTSSGPIFRLIEGNRREVSLDGKILNELIFKNYTINIARKNLDPKYRWLDANEKTILNLLNESDLNSKAEAHFRLAYPFLSLTLPIIVFVFFFCFPKSYNNQIYLITTSLLLSLFIQLLLISMRRVLINNPSLWFCFYLIPIMPLIFSFLLITFKNNILIFQNLFKQNVHK